MPDSNSAYLPKDFIETAEGLLFAVLQAGKEETGMGQKVLSFLRYVKNAETDTWQKLNTLQASNYIKTHYPRYLHHSVMLDADVHVIAIGDIKAHHQPKTRLQQILSQQSRDEIQQDLAKLCRLFQEQGLDLGEIGITGSLLINAQNGNSDLDLVIYNREIFQQCRKITENLTSQGRLDEFSESAWREIYTRRECALDFERYVWHERRKYNKGLINGRKFDLNFVDPGPVNPEISYQKVKMVKFQAIIADDRFAFDYPAVFYLDHEEFKVVLCYTATYTGQAFAGEMVEISGVLEQAADGNRRIIVGTSREAPGEYIKVIGSQA